jgi:antitoxin HicB
MPTKRHPHPNIGSTLQSLFEETGEAWEVHLLAQKKLLAMKLRERMSALHMTKSRLAQKAGTSRSQVDRCLDPDDIGMTLTSLARAAAALDVNWSFAFKQPKRKSRKAAAA